MEYIVRSDDRHGQITAKGNPRDIVDMMEDLLKEGIVEVDRDLGAVLVVKDLSENSLKIKVRKAASIASRRWPGIFPT